MLISVFFSLFISFVVFSEQDLERENVHMDSVRKNGKSSVDDLKKRMDEFYKKNKSPIDKIVDDIDKKASLGSSSFKPPGITEKANSFGEQFIADFKSDKNMQRWIREFTKNVYYKELYRGKSFKVKNIEERLVRTYSEIMDGNALPSVFGDSVFTPDERIYIFLSSSVPVSVWRNYVKAVRVIGSRNVYLVLRGCIGKEGCKKIMPTVSFIKEVSFEGVGVDSSKGANIIIDPYLFRFYRVQVVPTIVYARGVSLINVGSEGYKENLKSDVHYYKIEGDVSLFYFVEKLLEDERVNSKGLKKILDIGRGF